MRQFGPGCIVRYTPARIFLCCAPPAAHLPRRTSRGALPCVFGLFQAPRGPFGAIRAAPFRSACGLCGPSVRRVISAAFLSFRARFSRPFRSARDFCGLSFVSSTVSAPLTFRARFVQPLSAPNKVSAPLPFRTQPVRPRPVCSLAGPVRVGARGGLTSAGCSFATPRHTPRRRRAPHQ